MTKTKIRTFKTKIKESLVRKCASFLQYECKICGVYCYITEWHSGKSNRLICPFGCVGEDACSERFEPRRKLFCDIKEVWE